LNAKILQTAQQTDPSKWNIMQYGYHVTGLGAPAFIGRLVNENPTK
jgi:hypothetical protein